MCYGNLDKQILSRKISLVFLFVQMNVNIYTSPSGSFRTYVVVILSYLVQCYVYQVFTSTITIRTSHDQSMATNDGGAGGGYVTRFLSAARAYVVVHE